jgi:hypothetical protein
MSKKHLVFPTNSKVSLVTSTFYIIERLIANVNIGDTFATLSTKPLPANVSMTYK